MESFNPGCFIIVVDTIERRPNAGLKISTALIDPGGQLTHRHGRIALIWVRERIAAVRDVGSLEKRGFALLIPLVWIDHPFGKVPEFGTGNAEKKRWNLIEK